MLIFSRVDLTVTLTAITDVCYAANAKNVMRDSILPLSLENKTLIGEPALIWDTS